MLSLLTLLVTPALVAPAPQTATTVPTNFKLSLAAKGGTGQLSWTANHAIDIWIEGLEGKYGAPGSGLPTRGGKLDVPPGHYRVVASGLCSQVIGVWVDVK